MTYVSGKITLSKSSLDKQKVSSLEIKLRFDDFLLSVATIVSSEAELNTLIGESASDGLPLSLLSNSCLLAEVFTNDSLPETYKKTFNASSSYKFAIYSKHTRSADAQCFIIKQPFLKNVSFRKSIGVKFDKKKGC